MLLDIVQSNANVEHILNEVRQRWGDDYVLVTLNGLVLGTQGRI